MIYFSKDKVLLLHELVAYEADGNIGLCDETLLKLSLEGGFYLNGKNSIPSKGRTDCMAAFYTVI